VTVSLAQYLEAVPEPVVRRLCDARRVLAVSHENPDADTLGAALAICRITEALGASATPVCTDPIPPLYDYLPGVERFRTDPDPAVDYDLLVISDCGSIDRIGAVRDRHAALFEALPRLVVDHHASNAAVAATDWVDPMSAATCEMTTLLTVRLGIPLDEGGGALATALMSGIVMDTATFAHPNTTPRTLTVAAALVEAGAPLSDISRRLYRTKPEAQLKLFGRVLERLQTTAGGRVIHSTLTDADIDAAGALPAHGEGIIDLLAQAEEADVAILFKEAGDGTRISVRTRSNGVDATVLTGHFGGGGHARAAGATIERRLDEARVAVLAEAEKLVAAIAR
jgi:phosphoesterase RecJ-like protein